MEKTNDSNFKSEERNLKLQLIKSELMSTLGGATAKSKAVTKKVATPKSSKEKKNSAPKKSAPKSPKKKYPNKKDTKKKDTKKKDSKKETKSKTKPLTEETETDSTTRKWDDSKTRTLLKGQFSAEEEKKVIEALCEFAYINDLDEGSLLQLITEKQTKKDSSVWTKISECLPDRSVQSIHNFCHRKCNPYNYKGDWSEEEVAKLTLLHKEHGAKWELIGKELERTATNVKDKFKQIGGKNYKSRVKEFNLSLCLKLLKYIQNYIIDSVSNEMFKYPYKFKKDLETKCNAVFLLDFNKFLIDSSIKETPSRVIIRNILKLLIDSEVLEKIVDDKIEISWSAISEKFSVYSATDCKNNWDKILREFNLVEKSQLRKDLKMVKHLLKCEYDTVDEINYSLMKNKRTEEENKLKLEEMVRLNDIYSVKSLPDILAKVQEDLEQRLNVYMNSVKIDDREFNEELRKNQPLNIGKIYNDFLNNKRERE